MWPDEHSRGLDYGRHLSKGRGKHKRYSGDIGYHKNFPQVQWLIDAVVQETAP